MTAPTFNQQFELITKTLGQLRIERTKENVIRFDLLVAQLENLQMIHNLEVVKGGTK